MVRFHINAIYAVAVSILLPPVMLHGRSAQQQLGETQKEPAATLQGRVRDSANRPVAGAAVSLRAKDVKILTVQTDSAGAYRLSGIRPGTYVLRAEMADYDQADSSPFVLAPHETRTINLTLNVSKVAAKDLSESLPEFFDEPHFTVAGVTDTTNLGGHGSDAIARNRDALARATAALSKQPDANSVPDSSRPTTEKSLREAAARQPEDFDANYRLGKLLVDEAKAQEGIPYLERASRLDPGNFDNALELALAYAGTGNYAQAHSDARALLAARGRTREQKAELHHLLGDADERVGDALEAVREYQSAAELDPSETNLFDWGAELLIHRAADPAIEVFTKGNQLFPHSVRMLTGLGAAWYSFGSYDEAARRLCEASDLNPKDAAPYLFMGKLQAVETKQSEAILERLARFAQLEPQNALADYYYAASLWKQRKSPDDMENDEKIKSLLENAVHLDPQLGLAYLELGIVYSQEKDIPKAISAFQSAIEATPQLEQAHYRLAQLYRQNGETPKAKAELQLYEQISAEKTKATERQRHELQQFVYEMRDRPPGLQPQ
jgi:tetratricopeptide (TPR) repeat protein